MLKNIEIYIDSLLGRFAHVLADLFRFKLDIELSKLGFLSSTANEFKNLFSHQSSLKHNGRYGFRKERMTFLIRHFEYKFRFLSWSFIRALIDITDSVQLIRKNTGIIIITMFAHRVTNGVFLSIGFCCCSPKNKKLRLDIWKNFKPNETSE